MLDSLDKKIIAAMQADLPIVAEPYRELAERLGISETELLRRLKSYRETGKMRKMGAVLRHRIVGYAANALCAWIVPESRRDEIGELFIASEAVTHCYTRLPQADWPYNFYIMLHAHTRQECKMMAAELAQAANIKDYIMLFSTREWKKASMRYFSEENQADMGSI
ncbi:MAG: AsnC family transcriptional regulator [Veillonellales bacterium]